MNQFGLPFEIWSKIFGHLDFKMLNRTTLVCKSWLEMIRNDFNISGELTLNSFNKMEATEINSIISKWNKVKVLYVYMNLFSSLQFLDGMSTH